MPGAAMGASVIKQPHRVVAFAASCRLMPAVPSPVGEEFLNADDNFLNATTHRDPPFRARGNYAAPCPKKLCPISNPSPNAMMIVPESGVFPSFLAHVDRIMPFCAWIVRSRCLTKSALAGDHQSEDLGNQDSQ